jgi:type IV fimbrial biogenesis protein FimT
MKRLAAFTLIELMIVIAIVGIISMIAAPSFRTYISNSTANKLSSQVMIDIMYTRNLAITNERTARMIPTDATPGGGTLAAGGGVDWAAGWQIVDVGPPQVVMRTSSGGGVNAQIRSIDNANVLDRANPVEFDANGFAVRQGTIAVGVLGCAGDNAQTIRINQIGQIIATDIDCPVAFAGL